MTTRMVFLAMLLTGFALCAGAQAPPVENPDQLSISLTKSTADQMARCRDRTLTSSLNSQ